MVLTVSSTALITLDKVISAGDLDNIYPPEGPLELLTKLFFFNFKKICSRKDIDIPCLNEISVRFIGFLALFYLVNLSIPTKIVKYRNK
jgi:hypothetical protein